MTDWSPEPMSDMATLIREEDNRIFGDQVAQIKAIVAQHDRGEILAHEMLEAVSNVFGY